MIANRQRRSRAHSVSYHTGSFLCAIVLLASPSWLLAAGDIYKSVDAQGHVIYSDQAGGMAAPQQSTVEISSTSSDSDTEVRATDAPPQLPDSEQPPCPEEGYLWTPGYWSWNAAGYYWVQGGWVQPPRVGVLWTPGYWGYVDAVYIFHRGYWGPHIGYYGGINYGHGYFGVGFAGGHWVGNSFAYNRTVSNVDERVFHNIYREPVSNEALRSRVSYNNGPGGTKSVPTAQERGFSAESHIAPTPQQHQILVQAARNPTLVRQATVRAAQSASPAASNNHPIAAAVPRPAVFNAPAPVIAHNSVPERAISQRQAQAPVSPKTVAAAHPAVTHTNTSRASSTGSRLPAH